MTTLTGTRRSAPLLLLLAALLLALSSAPAWAQTTTLTISGLKAHYHTGDEATLIAVQDPQTEEDHYHWFVRKDGAADFEVVRGVGGDTYSFTVSADMAGAEVQVKLYDHDHQVIAESSVVTVVIDDHDHDHDHDHGHGDDGHGDHGHGNDGHGDDEVAGGTQEQAPVGGVPAGFGGTATSTTVPSAAMALLAIALAAVGMRARPVLTRR